MSKYYNLSEETLQKFKEVYDSKKVPFTLSFNFIGCEQKQLIKISKVTEQYSMIINKDLNVIINDELMGTFDDEIITILMEQEIDRITINSDTGKIKLIKPDFVTFGGLIKKYGLEKVARANDIQELYDEQKQDDILEF
jgi:hypothetical protein